MFILRNRTLSSLYYPWLLNLCQKWWFTAEVHFDFIESYLVMYYCTLFIFNFSSRIFSCLSCSLPWRFPIWSLLGNCRLLIIRFIYSLLFLEVWRNVLLQLIIFLWIFLYFFCHLFTKRQLFKRSSHRITCFVQTRICLWDICLQLFYIGTLWIFFFGILLLIATHISKRAQEGFGLLVMAFRELLVVLGLESYWSCCTRTKIFHNRLALLTTW